MAQALRLLCCERETIMRRHLLAIVFAGVLCWGLVACVGAPADGDLLQESQAGESESTMPSVPTYDAESFELDGWSVKITDAEIVFDKRSGRDDLVVYMTAKNGNDEAGAFSGVANIFATQGNRDLRQANAMKDNGEFYLDLDPFNEPVESGKEIEIMYGWELEDYETVNVVFTGFYEGVERNTVHFDVAACQSDEAAAVEAGERVGVDAKHAAKDAALEGAKITLVDPWYLDSSDGTHAELRQDETPAQLSVVTSDEQESAEAWANRIRENYTEGSNVSTVRVGGTTFFCFYPTDNQFLLFADCPDGEHAVNIRGMFVTLEEATPQIEEIVLLKSDPDGEADDDSEDEGAEAEDGESADEVTGEGEDASGNTEGVDQASSESASGSDTVDTNGMGEINDRGVGEDRYQEGGEGYSQDLGYEDAYYEDVYYY